MMKKVMALVLCCLIILTACVPKSAEQSSLPSEPTSVSQGVQKSVEDTSEESIASLSVEESSSQNSSIQSEELSFDSLSDPDLSIYLEDTVYTQLIEDLDSDEYFVENVEAIYLSKEYLDEVAFNSQENAFFGYTLSEIHEQFEEGSFIFTLDENNQTVVQEFEEYDDTYEQAIRNVAIGTGVIVLCVTVASVTTAAAPAISVILAVSAKSGAAAALSSGLISGVSSGILKGVETKNFDEALKTAISVGSESFKWGAISGALIGGAAQATSLHGATLNGLTMNQAAIIQRESLYPLNVIKQFNSMDEYLALKNAGVTTNMVNGKTALIQKINPDYIDEFGNTNMQRMLNGNAPLDPSGKAYELHHIGQNDNASLAILTQNQHDQIPNLVDESLINRNAFSTIRRNFWKDYAQKLLDGVL